MVITLFPIYLTIIVYRVFLLSTDAYAEIGKLAPYGWFRSLTCPYVVSNDEQDGISLLTSSIVLEMSGKVSYKSLEKNLYTKDSSTIIDIYETKYATPEVIKEYSKPYGSDIEIGNAVITQGTIRKDERVFGLKYARPGIYDSGNLMYMDFKNFYPNLVKEIGCLSLIHI